MLPEQEKSLLRTFKTAIPKSRRKGTPHRVRINGEFVQMNSGKQIWSNLGNAKNAVRNHLETIFHNVPYAPSYQGRKDMIAEFIAKHIEYVPVQ